MTNQNCPSCGRLILGEPYRALDASEWCKSCADDAKDHCEANYASEEELGAVRFHSWVLGWLTRRAELVEPEPLERAGTTPPPSRSVATDSTSCGASSPTPYGPQTLFTSTSNEGVTHAATPGSWRLWRDSPW